MVAGRKASPKDVANTERLLEYWSHGEGAAKIQWEAPGAYERCILEVQKAVVKGGSAPLSSSTIHGLCANLAHRATGLWPGSDAYKRLHGHFGKSGKH